MTRDEILNMPAERRTNALIHESIFNKRVFSAFDDDGTGQYYDWDLQTPIPDYSAHEYHACRVLLEMSKRGYSWKITCTSEKYEPGFVCCEFSVEEKSTGCVTTDGFCITICRAALLAVMAE